MKTKEDCIFCKISSGDIPSKFVWSNEDVIAFHDMNPQAPVHVLLVPRHHSDNILDLAAEEEGRQVFSQLLAAVPRVADALGVSESGFRLIINTGKGGGQSVMHLHIHLVAGEGLSESIV
ncbi:MAG TPA: histidine triad nucleotide-binding protein [Clostridiaceae bacterium]|nr:histidine triad nucleotide-binding protein [Clostridiaceae bacterium]